MRGYIGTVIFAIFICDNNWLDKIDTVVKKVGSRLLRFLRETAIADCVGWPGVWPKLAFKLSSVFSFRFQVVVNVVA